MPWCANDRAVVQTVQKAVVFRKSSTLTGWSMLQFIDKVGRLRDLAATSSRRQLEVPQIKLLKFFEAVVKALFAAFCGIFRTLPHGVESRPSADFLRSPR